MASILLSEFAKENMQSLPEMQREKLAAFFEKLKLGNFDQVEFQGIAGAESNARLINVGSSLRVLALLLDEKTLLIDDVFSKRDVFASSEAAKQRRKKYSMAA